MSFLREAKLKEIDRLLAEGGASGHLQHLFENRSLTFSEIKEIIANVAEGKIEKTTEKLDGQALSFSYNVSNGEVKAARSMGDIKSGGMDADAIAKKFEDRGNVADAFNNAFAVLKQSIGSLPEKTLVSVFGTNANVWYTMEVVYAENPNVINYDSNNVVFHETPVFLKAGDGTVRKLTDAPGVEVLSSNIDRMQRAITMRNWKVRGPTVIRLKKLSDGSIQKRAISQIDAAMRAAGVSDSDTIDTYLRNLVIEELTELGLPHESINAVAERVLEHPHAPTLTQMKKIVPTEMYDSVNKFVKASPKLMKKLIAPIEHAVHLFAVEVLKGLHSTLISDPEGEVKRIKAQVARAIKAIEASGDDRAMDVLKVQLEKLGDVENITSAVEGVVFFWKGNAYKLTANFAPINQILGLFKYGRGGIPKLDTNEVLLRRAIRSVLRDS